MMSSGFTLHSVLPFQVPEQNSSYNQQHKKRRCERAFENRKSTGEGDMQRGHIWVRRKHANNAYIFKVVKQSCNHRDKAQIEYSGACLETFREQP